MWFNRSSKLVERISHLPTLRRLCPPKEGLTSCTMTHSSYLSLQQITSPTLKHFHIPPRKFPWLIVSILTVSKSLIEPLLCSAEASLAKELINLSAEAKDRLAHACVSKNADSSHIGRSYQKFADSCRSGLQTSKSTIHVRHGLPMALYLKFHLDRDLRCNQSYIILISRFLRVLPSELCSRSLCS